MSRNYDNWERLVHATLDREKLRQLARCDSIETDSSFRSSISSLSTSSFNLDMEFQLCPSTLLKIEKGSITQWFVNGSSDAIVNSTNERMIGDGGADGQIHRAAGPELQEACYKFAEVKPRIRCPTGEARITPGFGLPVSRVIHTVGLIYGVDASPETSLMNAYRSSLRLAKENNIEYIGLVAISTGAYGYPCEEAATVAISTVKEFAGDFKELHFILLLDSVFHVWSNKAYQLLIAT